MTLLYPEKIFAGQLGLPCLESLPNVSIHCQLLFQVIATMETFFHKLEF